MKKSLIVFGIVLLIVIGVFIFQKSNSPKIVTNNPISDIEAVLPQGSEMSYKNILDTVVAKCGNNIQLVYYFSIPNNESESGQQTDTYTFTAGNCGGVNDLVNVSYNRNTQHIAFTRQLVANTNNLLRPLPVSEWSINYIQAVNMATQSAPGKVFVSSNPGSTVTIAGLSHRQNQPFRWEVILKSADKTKKISLYIDPKTGNGLGEQ